MHSDWTLRAMLQQRYVRERLLDGSPRTAPEFFGVVNGLRKFKGCDVRLCELCDDLAIDYNAWLKEQGLAKATRAKHRRHLLALWKYSRRRRFWRDNLDERPEEPDIDPIRTPKREPEAWTIDQLGRILQAAVTLPGSICGIAARDWWPGLILTVYDTSLRISPIMYAPASAIDLEMGRFRVMAEFQKHDADQGFTLHGQTLEILRRFVRCNMERAFPWPYDPKGNWQKLRRGLREILTLAGLPIGPKDLFHKLRKTSLSYTKKEAGLDAAVDQAGHSSAQVTIRHYLDPTITGGRDAALKLPRPVYESRQLRLFPPDAAAG